MIGTREQQDYLAMQYYVYAEVTKSALHAKPPLSIRDVQWDDGAMAMVTTNHVVSVSTGSSHVDIEIPHGNPSQQSWCYAVKAIVQRAVDDLAAKGMIP
jgi:hypothetical protein